MAVAEYDIGLDSDGDLLIVNGDFVIVESTMEHMKSLTIDSPGDYKQNPLVGSAALSYSDDEGPQALLRMIAQQFAADGIDVTSLGINPDGSLNVNGSY